MQSECKSYSNLFSTRSATFLPLQKYPNGEQLATHQFVSSCAAAAGKGERFWSNEQRYPPLNSSSFDHPSHHIGVPPRLMVNYNDKSYQTKNVQLSHENAFAVSLNHTLSELVRKLN